jgi:hypothetical protein
MGDAGTMALVGGHVAVDFVNTLGGLPEDSDDEYLHGYSDLVIWCHRVGLLSVAEEARLTAFASLSDSVEAQRVLASAHRLRAALDAVLRAGLVSEPPRQLAAHWADLHHPDSAVAAAGRGRELKTST